MKQNISFTISVSVIKVMFRYYISTDLVLTDLKQNIKIGYKI